MDNLTLSICAIIEHQFQIHEPLAILVWVMFIVTNTFQNKTQVMFNKQVVVLK